LTTARVLVERRLAEEQAALAKSEAHARANAERVQLALAAGAIIGTWHWDLLTDRFTVDEAFASAFGLDPALGREGIPLAQIISTVHSDDRAALTEAIDEVIGRGGPYAHQYRTRRADGRYYWLEANGRVDKAQDGTALMFPGVLIDVEKRRADEAERVRVTEELRTLNETLEQRVADRTAELMRRRRRCVSRRRWRLSVN
jgi:PAS domain S-box-containing protein